MKSKVKVGPTTRASTALPWRPFARMPPTSFPRERCGPTATSMGTVPCCQTKLGSLGSSLGNPWHVCACLRLRKRPAMRKTVATVDRAGATVRARRVAWPWVATGSPKPVRWRWRCSGRVDTERRAGGGNSFVSCECGTCPASQEQREMLHLADSSGTCLDLEAGDRQRSSVQAIFHVAGGQRHACIGPGGSACSA